MTDTITTIRCSALPLAMICPGSARSAEVQINPVSDAADAGSAVHFALAEFIRSNGAELARGLAAEEALAEACDRFPTVDVEELRPLLWAGVRAWNQIEEWMPNPRVELALEGGVLTGHIDVDSVKGRRIDIVDWKSGRKDRIYRDQGFGYARLELFDVVDFNAGEDGADCIDEIGVHFVWLRTGEIESYTVSRARAEEWYSGMVATVINWDGAYHPGDHCVHCPRNHDCPAQTALVRRDVAMFSDGATTDLQAMPGPEFVQLHRKLKGLSSRAEDALKAMRAEVERRGGDVDAGDGTHLFLAEENGHRTVDALRAWPALQSRLSDEELAPAIKISLSKVEKAVADKAGKGRGAAAKRALAEDLEKAGAVTQPTIHKLRDERKK